VCQVEHVQVLFGRPSATGDLTSRRERPMRMRTG